MKDDSQVGVRGSGWGWVGVGGSGWEGVEVGGSGWEHKMVKPIFFYLDKEELIQQVCLKK